MPVVFPTFSGEGNPRGILASFIIAVRDFLDELVTTESAQPMSSVFFPELVPEMSDAWEDAKPRFSLVASVHQGDQTAMIEHGLGGRELRFKLSVIRFHYARYLSVGKSVLRRLLDVIDDLLDSILDWVAKGGAISEIKDFIKDSVDDDSD